MAVCLKRGCIPSKTLLSRESVALRCAAGGNLGLEFGVPDIDLDKVRGFKDRVVSKLTGGLDHLAEKRGVQVLQARAEFESSDTIRLAGGEISKLEFEHAIIATGLVAHRPTRHGLQ